jgi:hypothetical protein
MDRVGSNVPRRLDNLSPIEMGGDGGFASDFDGLVRLGDVLRAGFHSVMDCDGRDPHLAGCTTDPARDLPPIGDEKFAK